MKAGINILYILSWYYIEVMTGVLIYPEEEMKYTVKRLARHIDSKAKFMYKISEKEIFGYEKYENVYLGYTMREWKYPESLSRFCYLNEGRLKNMSTVLFCPFFNPVDLIVREKNMKKFAEFVKEFQQENEFRNAIVCSLNEEDRDSK